MTTDFGLEKRQRGQAGGFPLALFFWLTITLTSAQALAAPGDHMVGLNFGQVMLLTDWSDRADDGIGFQLNHVFTASDLLALQTTIHYSSHSNTAQNNSLSIKGLIPNLRVNLAYIDKLTLYGLAGLGLFLLDETIGDRSGSVTTLGFDAGPGLDLELTEHFHFNMSLAFTTVFGKDDPSTATAGRNGITIGGTYLALMLGAAYKF